MTLAIKGNVKLEETVCPEAVVLVNNFKKSTDGETTYFTMTFYENESLGNEIVDYDIYGFSTPLNDDENLLVKCALDVVRIVFLPEGEVVEITQGS